MVCPLLFPETRNYTLALTYDTNHNILAKKQSDVITVAGGSAIPQKGTSYDWQYEYAGRQPHAPTHIGNRSFTYDLNGNQTGWQSDVNGTRRHILWDEENRIAEIDDNGQRNRYVYDAKGERTVKLTRQGETVYVNQYYVVRNRSVVSKHLYAGSGRIVTHLVMGTAPGNEGRGAPGNGHGSDKVPTTGNGNAGNVKGNNGHAGNDKEKGNNGLHLGQLKNGKQNPGQGRDRRSDTANEHAQDVYKNPTLTGEMPGQGSGDGSARRAIDSDAPVLITEGEASVEINGDTSAGEVTVDGVTESFPTPVVNGQSEFIWYYHPDHLGSTGFVTDQNGELYEHVEYFPFGETWLQEHSNTQRTPYLYTGKELDEETGLYYYGARYYDPRTGVWQSADPILDEYLNGKGNGGVFQPLNLAFFSYSYQNPVLLSDPDGNVVRIVTVAGKFAYKAYQVYKKTGKVDAQSLKKAGLDEQVGIADDLNTIFLDNDASVFEKIGAGVDLIIGTETTDGEIRDVIPTVGKAKNKGGKTGSYTNHHESGTEYHGKGGVERQRKSSRREAREHNDDEFVWGEYTTAKNHREAYKDESRRIERNPGGVKSDANYNEKASPGDRYRREDGDG